VSKAFTKEDDGGTPQFVRSRPPLPRGVPNYVTARGLAALREERGGLESERSRWEAAGDAAAAAAVTARLVELDARIGGAEVVGAPAGEGRETIRFGAWVVLVGEGEREIERRFQIVGVDEADAASGRIAFTAPLARALLGRRAGEIAQVDTQHGEEGWLIRAIAYETPDPG
jgi:transcription elongation factor GreB